MNQQYTHRAELQLHTVLSDRISVITPQAAIEAAVGMGLSAVAITDQGSVQSAYSVTRFHRQYADKIKLIYGLQLTGEVPVVLLAKDSQGIKALRNICSAMDDRHRVPERVVQENRAHLLVGCNPGQKAADLRFYDYVMLSPNAAPEENRKLYAHAKELGIPVAAAGNCRYILPEEKVCTDVLYETWRKQPADPWATHLYSTEEMLEAFAFLGKEAAYEVVVENPNKIADSIPQLQPVAEDLPYFLIPGAFEKVSALCNEKLRELYGTQPPQEFMDRFTDERCALGANASIFLLSHKIANFVQENVGIKSNRGSVGSTLIAYLLGISDINPMPAHYYCPRCKYVEFTEGDSGYDLPTKACPHCGGEMHGDGHNIPYETCFGVDYLDVDIDINVPEQVRLDVIAFLRDLWGADRVAYAGTIATSQMRFAKQLVEQYLKNHTVEMDSAAIEKKITGVKRGEGHHPAGVVLLPEGMEWSDITALRPVEPVGGVDKVTHAEFYETEGYLQKIDILGYNVMDRLVKLFEMTGVQPQQVSYNDPKVYDLFKACNTNGIPEFSSDICKSVLARLKDIRFSDLVRVSGMMHGTNTWNDNGEVLMETHPFRELISTRDDVFLTMYQYGIERKDAFMLMENTRKGRLPWPGKYIRKSRSTDRCVEILKDSNVPQWYVDSMCKIFYLFPKAHATSYTKLAVAMAWFKVYYPDAFYEVMLTDPLAEKLKNCSSTELEALLKDTYNDEISMRRERDIIGLLLERQ